MNEPLQRYKVLQLINGLGVGGTEKSLLQVLPKLDRNLYDITICSLKDEGVYGKILADEYDFELVALNGRGKWDIGVYWGLINYLRDKDFVIIHSYLYWANILARLAKRKLKIPVVINSVRDTEVWMRWYHKWIDRYMSRWVDLIVCCSNAVADFTIKETGISPYYFQVVYNGINVRDYRVKVDKKKYHQEFDLPSDAKVIGVITRLVEPKKGLAYLLEAFKIIAAKKDNAYLLIVGDGPARKKLIRKAKRLKIQDQVRFIESRNDIPQLLKVLDVFTLFSNYEGFGIAIIEAMAAGRPVVASRVGGIKEIIVDGETGYMVQPRNVKEMADKCLALLENTKLANKMGRAGRKRVGEHFSLRETVHRTGLIYASLLRLKKIIKREV